MGKADYYSSGTYNGICDRCGFKYKFNKLKRTWDGLFVCSRCFENRNPQDFVKGVSDDPSVSESRPDSPPTFTTEATNLIVPS